MCNLKYLIAVIIISTATLSIAQTSLTKSAPRATSKYLRLAGTDMLIPTQEQYTSISQPSNIKLIDSEINITYLQNDDAQAIQLLNNYKEGLTFLDTTTIDYGTYTANVYKTEVKGFNKAVDIWHVSRGPYGYVCAFEYQREQGKGKRVQEYIEGMVLDHSSKIPYNQHLPFDVELADGFEFADFRFMGMHTIVSKGGIPMETNTIMFSSVTAVSDRDLQEFETMSSIDPKNSTVQKREGKQVLIKKEAPLKDGVTNQLFLVIDGQQAFSGYIVAHDSDKMETLIQMVNSISAK